MNVFGLQVLMVLGVLVLLFGSLIDSFFTMTGAGMIVIALGIKPKKSS